MKKLFLLIFAAIACCCEVRAEVYELTLDESIEIAKERSYQMQALLKNLDISSYNLKAATSRLKTKITMDFTLPNYTETISEFEDTSGLYFYPKKMLYNSGGLSVRQPLPTDGMVYVTGGLSLVNDYYSDVRSSNLNTRIGLSQPIHSLYGYNTIKSSLKTAKLQYEMAQKGLKRAELDLVYFVSSAYYGLLSMQKSMEIALMDFERQNDAYEISKNKFAAGLLKEVEALQMEVDLAEARNRYDINVMNYVAAANDFKNLIGLDLSDEIKLKSDLKFEVVHVDMETAIRSAIDNRLEIREREIQIELQKLTLKQQKSTRLPTINLNAYYERSGINRQLLSKGLTSSLDNMWSDFGQRPSNFGVGLNIVVPIFDWGERKANVKAAELALQRNKLSKEDEERSIETEVRNLVANVQSNLSRLQLLEKNILVAEKSFAITVQRFSDGDITSDALAQERMRLNSAYDSHLVAYITYKLGLSDLTRKTFYDFVNNVRIE